MGLRNDSEVVVSGLGHVGPAGGGPAALLQALAAGELSLTEVDRGGGFHRPHGSRYAALMRSEAVSAWLEGHQFRRVAPPSRAALAATRQGLEAARLADRSAHTRTAVIVGTAYGPSSVTEQLLRQILKLGPEHASPALFTESVSNAPASQVAIAWKMLGPTLAIQQREASDLLAVGEALRMLRHGWAERALVLVVEEMTPLLHALLDRFRALARSCRGIEEKARPFDRRRNGFLAAEGATALVLEPVALAEARGVRPLAVVRGRAAAFDTTASAWDWGRGADRLARTVARALAREGIEKETIEAVVSGASGSVSGDRLEAEVLRTLFAGHRLPPIATPKRILGEYGGGFLAAALLAASGEGRIPPTEDFEKDASLEIEPAWVSSAPRRLLITALASGGPAAWLVLDQPEAGSLG